MIKIYTTIATAAALSASAANAAIILSTGDVTSPTGSARGNWHYQSATLNEGDFTSSADALTATVSLNSVSFVRYSSGTSTAGTHHLAVLTDANDINSVIATSQNSINTNGAAFGSVMTWNFNSELLSSTTEYFYAFYADTNTNNVIDSGDTAVTARIWDQGNIVGSLANTPAGGSATTGESAYLSINATAVPEPSATALLGLGGLAILLRRHK